MKIISKLQYRYILLSLVINSFWAKITAAAAPPNALDRMKQTAVDSGYSTTNISPQIVIVQIIIYALGFVGLIFLIMIIYSGYQWMTAGGNEEKIGLAKKRLQYAVIGLVVIVAAYTISSYIMSSMIKATTSYYYGWPYYP